jgi:hypothetical protein
VVAYVEFWLEGKLSRDLISCSKKLASEAELVWRELRLRASEVPCMLHLRFHRLDYFARLHERRRCYDKSIIYWS